MQDIQKFAEQLKNRLKNASYWTIQTFDEDGYGNDDSEEVVTLHRAFEIIDKMVKNKDTDTSATSLVECGAWIRCKDQTPQYSGTYIASVEVKVDGEKTLIENKCEYSIYDGWTAPGKVIAWKSE